MIEYEITNNTFIFSIIENDKIIPFDNWSNNNNCIYYFPLSNLIDNGFAYVSQYGKCNIPCDNIYQLDSEERSILGLPEIYPFDIYIQSNGTLNQTEFKFKLNYMSFAPDGEIFYTQRNNNILYIGNHQYLLSKDQYILSQAITTFNETTESLKNPVYNLSEFFKIKSLGKIANCTFDEYLEKENVYTPDKIKLDINPIDEGFSILPVINIQEKEKFTQTFDKQRKVLDIYPIPTENGGRRRVVLDEKQKDGLKKLKTNNCRFNNNSELQDIIKSPTAYFDPELFDLSELYSERVIKIGLYQPKFYAFICPYKSSWIPGAKIEDPVNGTKNIFIENIDDIHKLEQAIILAEKEKSPIVDFQNSNIPIEDAHSLLELSKEQIKHPSQPLSAEIQKKRKVLIIEDNAETLGFSSQFNILKTDNKFTLFKDEYLESSFALKKHQEEGIAWLQYLLKNKSSGCLIADDMGLGKTLQVLYLIDWYSRLNISQKPFLIVAPVSLLENWEQEYHRFFKAPRLKISVLTSKKIPRYFDILTIEELKNCEIILTNYESLRNSQLNFCAIDYSIIVLDEAQKIKTPGTLVTNAAKALKGDFKIAMTGTPVENSFIDLWCIMDFSVPGLLGNAKDFIKKYQSPLKDTNTNVQKLGTEIHKSLGNYFIRRLKSDVAKDLPSKNELHIRQQMPDIQLHKYSAVLNNYIEDSSGYDILRTIMKMREISDHPLLFDTDLSNFSDKEIINSSARLIVTIDILNKVRNKKEKAIIFAERKETQKMLQRICKSTYGINCNIINGDTPTSSATSSKQNESRQSCINKFQKSIGFNVIIMSPIAAGMGLNVTAANHVIHYSRHWNPAKENQATDRAYRIGQDKDVYVYYPMAVNNSFTTFDETLDSLLDRKKMLASSTLYPTDKIEISKEEIAESLLKGISKQETYPLSYSDIKNLNMKMFKIFIDIYFKRKGYSVQPINNLNNKKIDFILQNKDCGYLVNILKDSDQDISELYPATTYYQKIHNIPFEIIIISNPGHTYNISNPQNLPYIRIGENEFKSFLDSEKITYEDLIAKEL